MNANARSSWNSLAKRHGWKGDGTAFEFLSAKLEKDKANIAPVIVVKRHPEYATDIEVFGLPPDVRVINIDLGSNFDITKLADTDKPEITEFAIDKYAEVSDLPADHPARLFVEQIILEVESAFYDHSACQNCGKEWDNGQLNPIQDIHQRVEPGEPMPSGECPDCGALCQLIRT